MVLALQCKPGQEVRGVNLADQCLYWCAEKLPMHQVPAVVVVVEVDDDSTKPLETICAADVDQLYRDKYSYPWEMHSLLSADGWHLKEADINTESDGFDYLDEAEVLILKEAWTMMDPFSKDQEALGEKSIKCRHQTGYLFTSEVLVALKLCGLYEVPSEGTDDAKEWEDRVWQPREERARNRKSNKYELEDPAHDNMEPCHLGDIDRDMKGAVAIGWPEFLAIVGALQNPKKCRSGKPGLTRVSTGQASR
jgi:hypothetical protein